MSAQVYVEVSPFDKDIVLLALECGVHGIIVEDEYLHEVEGLARCEFVSLSQIERIRFETKEDELQFAKDLRSKASTIFATTQNKEKYPILEKGWEIIPVENLLAQPDIAEKVCLEVRNLEEARLALGILERGVDKILYSCQNQDLKEILPQLQAIMSLSLSGVASLPLEVATVTVVKPVGLGHRVCVDTLSVLEVGQGMLTGNSSAFTFLVHAETEENNYVNARPFRVNAGAVHAYAMMPNDKTAYLEELNSGDEVLIVSADGACKNVVVGRVKVEVRPMLLIEAINSHGKKGSVFLQNAETIRVVNENGKPISVVALKEGDKILCHSDTAGRHFGMRVNESIQE